MSCHSVSRVRGGLHAYGSAPTHFLESGLPLRITSDKEAIYPQKTLSRNWTLRQSAPFVQSASLSLVSGGAKSTVLA